MPPDTNIPGARQPGLEHLVDHGGRGRVQEAVLGDRAREFTRVELGDVLFADPLQDRVGVIRGGEGAGRRIDGDPRQPGRGLQGRLGSTGEGRAHEIHPHPDGRLAAGLVLALNGQGLALTQLWLFSVAPLAGAVIAGLIYRMFETSASK